MTAKTLLTVFAAALSAAPLARADLVISVTPDSVTAGSVGNATDVTLINTGLSDIAIGAFSFGLVATDPAVTFTGATTSTSDPYVFGAGSLFGPDIATTLGTTLIASDISFSGGVVTAGGTVGLGHVLFDVASNAAGSGFTISLSAAETSLADPVGDAISITGVQAGQISVVPNSSVPEPSAAWILAGPLLLIALARRRQRFSYRNR